MYKPFEPTKPLPTITYNKQIYSEHYYDSVSLSELILDIQRVLALDDERVKEIAPTVLILPHSDDTITVSLSEEVTEENKSYKKQMATYEADMIKYQEKLKKWEEWEKNRNTTEIARKIKAAKAILKKYGEE